MITVGIDVGSITTKAAVVKDGNLISDRMMLTGYNAQDAGTKVYEDIIADLGIKASAVDKIIATGYGRKSVAIADKAVTATETVVGKLSDPHTGIVFLLPVAQTWGMVKTTKESNA